MPFQPTKRRKSIPQSNMTLPQIVSFDDVENAIVRNECTHNILKYRGFLADCKSAYAGSIPTSASTLENPVD